MSLRIASVFALAFAPVVVAQSPAGRWDATIHINNLDVPFRFELSGTPPNIQGAFFNGEEKVLSTGGRYQDGSLTLRWDYLATRLEAKYKDGVIEGRYIGKAGPGEGGSYPIRATRYAGPPTHDPNTPSIGGLWIIPNKSPKGEAAWRFVVQQSGADVSAAILRIDGDTGAITGTYRNGKFFLSHFSGARPNVLEVTLLGDGTLDILQNGKTRLTAVRAEQAQAEGVPAPDDPATHTGVKDVSEPFRFSFPDLSGKLVANTDPRFHNKVVLVEITGSWCPNCHDEAPFLVELYRKYHDRGLEIVALSFEEEEQLKDPARLRAFVKKYGIDYTVLLCGVPDEAAGKLTQAVHWNAWPTTFFLGRDGRVRSVHTGFPSSASGDLYRQAKTEFAAHVERLLAENQSAQQ
jgi:thiol-disulfide isomerase/thioredoxin